MTDQIARLKNARPLSFARIDAFSRHAIWSVDFPGPAFFTARCYALRSTNSVRLSVCLSVTLVDCVHMVRPTIVISSPYGSNFWRYLYHPKIRRGSPQTRTLNEGWVCTNWRFSTNKPLYLQNGARYDKGYYWSLIGTRIRAFDWYQNQRP